MIFKIVLAYHICEGNCSNEVYGIQGEISQQQRGSGDRNPQLSMNRSVCLNLNKNNNGNEI